MYHVQDGRGVSHSAKDGIIFGHSVSEFRLENRPHFLPGKFVLNRPTDQAFPDSVGASVELSVGVVPLAAATRALVRACEAPAASSSDRRADPNGMLVSLRYGTSPDGLNRLWKNRTVRAELTMIWPQQGGAGGAAFRTSTRTIR